MAQRIEYLKGEKIGECIYLYELTKKDCRRAMFKCKCGNYFSSDINRIKRGYTKSCGCLALESRTKHGLTGSRLYKKWKGIKRRCYNKNEDMYHIYGGRGIKMCDEWLNDPKAFIDYCKTLDGWNDKSLTIDRIECEEDYKPGNIRFATHTIQARNMRMKKNNTSGFVGVREVSGRYRATIGINYKIKHLGCFSTATDAVISRDMYIIDNNLEGFNLQVL